MSQETLRERRVTLSREGTLRIEFPYDRHLVALVKGLPGREWKGGEKFWTVPVEHVVATVDLLRPHGFAFDAETLALYDARREGAGDHLTVSQLNLHVREAVRGAFPLPLWVVGEVSGFNRNAHRKWVSFQLVERSPTGEAVAQVEAVLVAEDRANLAAKLEREGAPFRLEDEIQVRVLVQVDLHVEWGRYRVIVKDIDVAYTLGEVARRREEIVRKLVAEGIVERNRNLPFPALPLRVGLVTSLGSDAYHDVLRTFHDSGYAFEVTVHGARVQGPTTEASVLNALDWFRDHARAFDLVLICRGGGSRTDLAWFDSEALGRAVALFPLPVVVGIGHEEDRCVLDEVGWRQKTPTAAAQFVVERVRGAVDRVNQALQRILGEAQGRLALLAEGHRQRAARLTQGVEDLVSREKRELTHRSHRLRRGVRGRLQAAHEMEDRFRVALGRAATAYLGRVDTRLAEVANRVSRGAQRDLAAARQRVTRALPLVGRRSRRQIARAGERLEDRAKRLHALDPQRVVERGYAIVRSGAGTVVTDAAQAPPETVLRVQLRRGVLRARSEGEER